MTSNELKELVKSHFSLVEVATTEEIANEITETFSEEATEEVVEEVFGEIADENSAFVLKFPGTELEVGDKVSVETTDGQSLDAPKYRYGAWPTLASLRQLAQYIYAEYLFRVSQH